MGRLQFPELLNFYPQNFGLGKSNFPQKVSTDLPDETFAVSRQVGRLQFPELLNFYPQNFGLGKSNFPQKVSTDLLN